MSHSADENEYRPGYEFVDGPSFVKFGEAINPMLSRLRGLVDARKLLEGKCESPIEMMLGADIIAQAGHILSENHLVLLPQYVMDRARWDFAIVRTPEPILFIECDGKEFHSTPDQIANDRRKDALAVKLGISLIRFSGAEISRYPDGCVHRVIEYLVRSGAIE